MGRFENALVALRGGQSTFAQFVQATRPHWKALSIYVVKRWDLPLWMDKEDVEQELHVAAWTFVGKFDDKRGKKLEEFVVWNAIDKAKKVAHKARGANRHRGADGNPSMYERPFTTFERATDERGAAAERMLSGAAVEAHQERTAVREEGYKRARTVCGKVRELLAVQALYHADDSLTEAAANLYEDYESRRLCRLGSEDHALSVVKHAVRTVGERMQFLSV
jgi:hypothetical protein